MSSDPTPPYGSARPAKGTPAGPGVVVVSLVCIFVANVLPGLGLVMALVMWFTSLRHNGTAVRLMAVALGLIPFVTFAGIYFLMGT